MTAKGYRRPGPVTYEAVHYRLLWDRGSASDNPCVKCGAQAEEWAYDHTDPDELTDPKGRAYSLDQGRYFPLCISCHRVQDGRGECRKGHPWTDESTYHYRGYRLCKICRRENMAAYKKRMRD